MQMGGLDKKVTAEMQEVLAMKPDDTNNNLDDSNNIISVEEEERHADPVEEVVSQEEEISDDDDSNYEEFVPDFVKSRTHRQYWTLGKESGTK